jgi:hypothetical protein
VHVIHIFAPRKLVDGNRILIECDFVTSDKRRALRFWIDKGNQDYLGDASALSNACLLALVPSALKIGEDILIEGPASERLVYHLNRLIIPFLSAARGQKAVVIDAPASQTSPPASSPRFTALGFSGGVDSFYSIASNLDSKAY